MEAIIRTNDKNAFNSLVLFLKTLHFEVETKHEKSTVLKSSVGKNKWELLEKIIAPLRKGLPADYKFDREEANAR